MFAALHVADFPLSALLRGNREAGSAPCAVLASGHVEETRGRLPLVAVNRAARFAGLHAGWPLNRALVRCPDLRVLTRDPVAEAMLAADLVALGESLSADFEVTATDTLLLDVSRRRLGHEWPPASPKLHGAELWWALAETAELAFLAVHHESTRSRHITPADLATLPVQTLAALPGAGLAMDLLDGWGVKSLGDLMALPRQALTSRLGPTAGHWHDVLHGRNRRPLRLHRPHAPLRQQVHFEEPLLAIEPLVFTCKRLLDQLETRLQERHLAVSLMVVELGLEHGGTLQREIRLPEPRTASAAMLAPLRAWLEPLRLDAPVVMLALDVKTTFAAVLQREWLGRQLPQPGRWIETLTKLEAMLGPHRVGIPMPSTSHTPDAFTLRSAAADSAAPLLQDAAPAPACPLPLHRYRPPRKIAVAHEAGHHRHPQPLALLTGPHAGPIRNHRGPFPSSGTWWDPEAFWQRLEWDIQSADGQLLRLVLIPPDHWQLDGIYQ